MRKKQVIHLFIYLFFGESEIFRLGTLIHERGYENFMHRFYKFIHFINNINLS